MSDKAFVIAVDKKYDSYLRYAKTQEEADTIAKELIAEESMDPCGTVTISVSTVQSIEIIKSRG